MPQIPKIGIPEYSYQRCPNIAQNAFRARERDMQRTMLDSPIPGTPWSPMRIPRNEVCAEKEES